MIYGSVCSGIEAASVAWHPLGWRAAFLSEIEKFPRAVLAHHWPKAPLHGDFTTIEAGQYEPIDLLVGGTPCQDFSVAGLRAGLAGERGNLTLEYLKLAARIRSRWLVWENVPGVLSSDGGRAFGAFLGGLAELGYGFAWRVLDAQHFGVPQRRRRVFVVGYLGDWRRAAAVLFERHSLSGNPAPRREAGQSAPTLPSRSSAGGGLGTDFDCDGGLVPSIAKPLGAHALSKGRGSDLDNSTYLAFAIQERAVSENLENGPQGKGYQPESAYTLEARNKVQAVAFALRGRDDGSVPEVSGDAVSALRAASGGSTRDMIAFDQTQITSKTNRSHPRPGAPCHTLAKGAQPPSIAGSAVRRLTPRECERLQGFPDDYTLIPLGKKLAADGPRYKALGNSMAVPVMRWIGERIQLIENTTFRSAA